MLQWPFACLLCGSYAQVAAFFALLMAIRVAIEGVGQVLNNLTVRYWWNNLTVRYWWNNLTVRLFNWGNSRWTLGLLLYLVFLTQDFWLIRLDVALSNLVLIILSFGI